MFLRRRRRPTGTRLLVWANAYLWTIMERANTAAPRVVIRMLKISPPSVVSEEDELGGEAGGGTFGPISP